MGARDNKGGDKWVGGGSSKRNRRGETQEGGTQRCLIIAMGESQETQDAGQTQEAGGFDPLLPFPPLSSSSPREPSETCGRLEEGNLDPLSTPTGLIRAAF